MSLFEDDISRYKSYLNEFSNFDSSMFNYCFLTELYDKLSKTLESYDLSNERREFFENEFYRQFPVVIIGDNGIREKEGEIEEMFKVTCDGDLHLDSRIPVSRFYGDNRVLLATWQLSGRNDPSPTFLRKLAQEARKGLE